MTSKVLDAKARTGSWILEKNANPQAVRGDGRKRGRSDRGRESLAGEASSS